MISVIIPAYNEEKSIEYVLSSLAKQNYRGKFEVILVNNNSQDLTVKKAEKFKGKLPLIIINETRQGRGAAKARGAEAAQGEILAYLDADSRANSNWLSTIEAAFSNPEVVGITGPWRVYDLPHGFTKWFLHSFQEIVMLPITLYLGHCDLNGMNMAFRAKAYRACGGFAKHLNVHDDFDLAKRLGKHGKIKYIKNLRVLTSGRRYKNGLIRGIISYHKGTLGYLRGGRADLEDIR